MVKFSLLVLILFTAAYSQQVAIIQNFYSAEIDSLQFWLSEMQIPSKVFDQGSYTSDSLANFDVVIWDDLSYGNGGFRSVDVYIFEEVYKQGKHLYFIGDDLGYNVTLFIPYPADSIITNLMHLTATSNTSGANSIVVHDSTHIVINGPYGKVESFSAYIDPDNGVATNTGEEILMKTNNGYDVVVANEDSTGKRVITQNALALKPNSDDQVHRKTLFKNSISWLIKNHTYISIDRTLFVNKYELIQNFPNPFNPTTTIEYFISQPNKVSIKIYNDLGQEIQKIDAGFKNAGKHYLEFNANNLSTGIYYYSLSINNVNVSVKKMLLIK
jgi:hypothetical protein